MATRKKSPMGADPLAWMKQDEAAPGEASEARVERKPRPRRRSRRKDGLDVALLEDSFALLAPQGEALVARFYEELFARFPALRPLFADSDPAAQQKKLLAALQLVVNSLRRPAQLRKALLALGEKHHAYGAKEEHYTAVADTLLDVMAEFAGEAWTDEVAAAWRNALNTVAATMLSADGIPEEKTMAASKKAMEESVMGPSPALNSLEAMYSILEHSPINIMIADADENIVFVNKQARDTLASVEDELAQYLPGFSVDSVVGGSIHRYHKDPEAIKRILHALGPDDVRHGEITPGRFVFEHQTRPLTDASGNHLGYAVQWKDVTEERLAAREVERLQSAIDGAQSNLMLCDEDLNITYVNPAVVRMLEAREEVLRERFPGFDAHDLVGRNIDMFHKNPAHQRALLGDPSRLPAKAEIKVADLEFEVNATAVLDGQGNYMGNMVEWRDITEQKAAERAIAGMIEAAARGDLHQRLDVEQYQGFIRKLGEGINAMLDAIVQPITDISAVMSSLAEGDLTRMTRSGYQGEFSVLSDAVNTSIANLQETVGGIRISAESITSAASEISQGNTDLSQRTEEQASSLEETASSMEELTSTVKQNADNARQANQLANGARDQAEQGGDVVQKAVDAMAEINSASKKIADIIGVIDEIAFQTNLLALNAAVEAARAGEQGRGFAVVASEVRNLAQRSASAAKEIKSLINDSVEKVGEGSKLVDRSGETLTEIVNSVKKVSDIVAEIAAASQEQSIGIEQVNKAITQLDEVTQQNAALVEEAAAAAESLDDQARDMSQRMAYFRLGEGMQNAGDGIDFASARSKHLQWKLRVRDFLAGRATLTPEQAVSHHDCDLGKWLYAEGMQKFGHLAEMQQLEAIHQDLHATIKRIVQFKEQGDMVAAEREAQAVDSISGEVVNLLNRLEQQVHDAQPARAPMAAAPSAAPSRPAPRPTPRPASRPAPAPRPVADDDSEWEEF